MSIEITAETKRWTAKRKPALTLEIIQGKTTASEAIRQCDLARSEIEDWLDNAKAGPIERTIQYHAPFFKPNREQDYATAWAFFSEQGKS